MEILFFSFSGSQDSMVYTLLSGTEGCQDGGVYSFLGFHGVFEVQFFVHRNQRFRKGVGGQRGWHKEIPPVPSHTTIGIQHPKIHHCISSRKSTDKTSDKRNTNNIEDQKTVLLVKAVVLSARAIMMTIIMMMMMMMMMTTNMIISTPRRIKVITTLSSSSSS